MALQDLTPQLRTRLNSTERAVGIFVGLALMLLFSGFCYYLYDTAKRKGRFLERIPYYVYVQSASGLKPGDIVTLMGLPIGEITEVTPMPPSAWFVDHNYNVFVRFLVKQPDYGYIWTDSFVKVTPADFLGNRQLEVTKGQTGRVTVKETPEGATLIQSDKQPTNYVALTKDSKGVWLRVEEYPAVTERLQKIADQVEQALPNFLNLTNQLTAVLDHSALAASNLNALASDTRPVVANLADITAQLRDFDGAFGRWMLSTNANRQLESALANANSTLAGLDTNLVAVADKLSVSLDHLASITSNLNAQVQSNTNILGSLSDAILHTDEFVQGLKHHWLFRSAFRPKNTNTLPARPQLPGLRP
jgi:ABC-type transporter Mla subunit MlaD